MWATPALPPSFPKCEFLVPGLQGLLHSGTAPSQLASRAACNMGLIMWELKTGTQALCLEMVLTPVQCGKRSVISPWL